MARAYAFASGSGPPPKEWRLKIAVEAYGVEAIFNRQLYAKEINCMNAVSQIVRAYWTREASKKWAEWDQKNPDLAKLLNLAGNLAKELGLIKELGSE